MSNKKFNNKKYFPADTLFVGIDMAKKDCYAVGLTSRGESISSIYKFNITMDSLEKFIAKIEKWKNDFNCGQIVIGLEPTGSFCYPVEKFLEQNNYEVKYVNPMHVKRTKEMYDNCPSKNDRKDAFLIARLLDEGKFLQKVKRTPEYESLKILVEEREFFLNQSVALKNHLISQLSCYFPEYSKLFSDLTGKACVKLLKTAPLPEDILKLGQEKLTKLLHESSKGCVGAEKAAQLIEAAQISLSCICDSDSVRFILKINIKELVRLNSIVTSFEEKMNKILETLEEYNFLKTIPRAGIVSISALLGYSGGLNNFKNTRELLKYLGMNTYEISSGVHKGKRKLSKRGPSIVRAKFYLLACNNLTSPKSIYSKIFNDMKSAGKESMVILVAFACKFIKIAYAVVKNKTEYNESLVWGKAEKTSPSIKRGAA